MKFDDFKKATLQQLLTIVRHEKCELPFKCFAESEIERRMTETGIPGLPCVMIGK